MSKKISLLLYPVLFLAFGISNIQAQYLKAYVGTGVPDVEDGVFDGNSGDIIGGTAEWGNFLLLDFVSDNPNIWIESFTLDFGPAASAFIDDIYNWGHNLDGVVVTSSSLDGNVYTASVMGMTDEVDVFYIHFDFDRNAAGHTPYGEDYIGATISATLNNGVNLSGTFDMVDLWVAMAQAGVSGQMVDVWIRDCYSDGGEVPSDTDCPQWYTSPDIFIDNDFDGILDAPVYGEDNILWAVVRNRGTDFAQDVNVNFYYRLNTTGLVFPDGANLIGSTTTDVPPNGSAQVWVPWNGLPYSPQAGHWCIGAVLNHPGDPAITPAVAGYEDNNVGIANIWFIAGRAGERLDISFSAGTGGESLFGFERWPRNFILRVINELPEWAMAMKGANPGTPFSLQRGEEKKVHLEVNIPKETKAHTAGMIKVEQVDEETGKVVGGVLYSIYEDHRPPQAINEVTALVGEKSVQLSWEPARIEERTGQEEKVAYYEIFRNGQPYAKVLRDEDPFAYGMQWTDRHLSGTRLAYAVQAVDEGGNVSAQSPAAEVTLPGGAGLFNWLTWLLLILLLLFILLYVLKGRARA